MGNMRKETELSLYKGIHFCKACKKSWEGYTHDFSRGHLVLLKGDIIIFIPEDILYEFPSEENFVLEDFFENRDWISINRCPECHSKRINTSQNNISDIVKVICSTVSFDDFEFKDGEWNLKNNFIE